MDNFDKRWAKSKRRQQHHNYNTTTTTTITTTRDTPTIASQVDTMLVVGLRVPQTMRDEFPDFDVPPLKEAKKIVEAVERERDREEALRQERGGKENEVRLHEMD